MTAPRVLVVDDEVPILDLVKGYLERERMEVMSADDGPTALEWVRGPASRADDDRCLRDHAHRPG